VLPNSGEAGLSGARNTGLRAARGEIVAFLDDDAVAEDTWLQELLRAYDYPAVIGAGGLALPLWIGGTPPRWLPSEFYWTVGCSYRGLPPGVAPVRNPIGASMSFRKSILDRVGGFSAGVGRIGRVPLGCEETELSIRAQRTDPAGVVLHIPTARVDHMVPLERVSWGYFFSRCWAEGLSKARVADMVGPDRALSSERTYTLRTLPSGVLHGVLDASGGDFAGLLRSGAIIAGFLTVATSYLRARLAPWR
jgi:glycosyltransferase involved in cell wall biosynthesis